MLSLVVAPHSARGEHREAQSRPKPRCKSMPLQKAFLKHRLPRTTASRGEYSFLVAVAVMAAGYSPI